MDVQFGIDTFGDITADTNGDLLPGDAVVRNVIEEAVLADSLGLDVIGVGEHHRNDFAISSPEMVLAAIGARTERIKLATAVTVLSSDDPVRVFERFSTLDAISGGRAEAVVGRGSFIESFPLFGYDLQDYEDLFEEKLELFAKLIQGERITWKGKLTQDLIDVELYPKLADGPLKTWVAVGGSPQSVVRAASYGLPLDAGDHRRPRRAVRPVRRAAPSGPRGARQGAAADRLPHLRPHRADRRRGQGAAVHAVARAVPQDRGRARLGPHGPLALRAGGRPRLDGRRLPRDGGAQDRRRREGAWR